MPTKRLAITAVPKQLNPLKSCPTSGRPLRSISVRISICNPTVSGGASNTLDKPPTTGMKEAPPIRRNMTRVAIIMTPQLPRNVARAAAISSWLGRCSYARLFPGVTANGASLPLAAIPKSPSTLPADNHSFPCAGCHTRSSRWIAPWRASRTAHSTPPDHVVHHFASNTIP